MTPSHGTIAGNYITGARDDAIAVGSSWRADPVKIIASHIEVRDNVIHNIEFGSGIYVHGIDGFRVSGNYVHNCDKGGIRAAQNANDGGYPLRNGTISGNLITCNLGLRANKFREGVLVTPNRASFVLRGEIMLAEDSAKGTQYPGPDITNVRVCNNIVSTDCNNGIYRNPSGLIEAPQFARNLIIEDNSVLFTDSTNADDHRGVFIAGCQGLHFGGNLVQGFPRQGAVFRKCSDLTITRNSFLENCMKSRTGTMVAILDANDPKHDFLTEFSYNLLARSTGTLARFLHLGNAGGKTAYRCMNNRKVITGARVMNPDQYDYPPRTGGSCWLDVD
jgi:hypothetical protein